MIYAENILICIAVPLILLLLFLRGRTRLFVGAFLAGMGVCLLSAYISGFISLAGTMGAENTAVYISPIIEELMKCLPLFFIHYLFKPGEERLFMVGAGIGAGFALFENCCYMLSTGADSLTFILIRSMAVGVMHIVSMVTLAVCVNLAVYFNALTVQSIAGAVSLAVTFHGLYNLLVSRPGPTSWVGYALPIVTALFLYVVFRQIYDRLVVKEVSENPPGS